MKITISQEGYSPTTISVESVFNKANKYDYWDGIEDLPDNKEFNGFGIGF